MIFPVYSLEGMIACAFPSDDDNDSDNGDGDDDDGGGGDGGDDCARILIWERRFSSSSFLCCKSFTNIMASSTITALSRCTRPHSFLTQVTTCNHPELGHFRIQGIKSCKGSKVIELGNNQLLPLSIAILKV